MWAVNGSLTSMIGGIRALLMQALHPGALAGIHDHSRVHDDPMRRLNGTIRWLAVTTFGSTDAAAAAAAGIGHVHERVRGTYTDALGRTQSYSASDASLARWVHDAFTEAFLGAHEVWGRQGTVDGDEYVREWAAAGRMLGVVDPPLTRDSLREQLREFEPELSADERVRDIVRFLRRPRLPWLVGLVYPVLFAGAVASLPAHYRALLGLRRPLWPAFTANRMLLAGMRVALGPVSPSERAARERIARLPAGA